MVQRVPMGGRRLAAGALLAWLAGSGLSWAQTTSPAGLDSGQTNRGSGNSSAASSLPSSGNSSPSNHKSGTTGQIAHHIKVAEEVAPSPELTKAEALNQKQDYAAAEPLLRKAVGDDPANYEAWFDLGFVENGLGKLDESIAAYRKSVASKPDVFESNLNLGLQLAKSGQPGAEQFLRAATALKPTSHVDEGRARAWLSLAHVLETTKPDDAMAAYKHAAELQPKDPEAHLAMGLLLEKQGNLLDAEHEYKQALMLDPTSSDALTGLANVYMHDRRFPEAEAVLRKLVATNPNDVAARIQLGRVLAAEGKNDEAMAELQTAQKLDAADASLQRDLADLYLLAKKYDHAESAYRALLAENPNDAALHENLGKALLEQKKFVDAQREFVAAVKLKPDMVLAYGDLAFAASENKDYPLAIQALDARAKIMPDEPITYFLRASAYDHLKDFKRASANYHLFLNAANGKYPEQEWQAKHRLIAIEPKK